MNRLLSAIGLPLIGALVAVGSAAAQSNGAKTDGTETAAPGGDRMSITFQLENDLFADTDRHYTNGVRASWISEDQSTVPHWLKKGLGKVYKLSPLENGAIDTRYGFALGQSMFTPEDITRSGLIADDRPYAGWLYLGLTLHAATDNKVGGSDFKILDTMELDLGIVGPQAYGEDAQTFVHKVIDSPRPQGWDNQLKNEPGIVLQFERKWRPQAATYGGLEVDAIPHWGISLGNVLTATNTGATLRFGQNLKRDFGPPHIRPALSGPATFDVSDGFAWYFFAGVDGRLVGRNIFLDGNTFADSHSVDKKTAVGDLQFGLAVLAGPFRFSYSQVRRTKEFDGQNQTDRFGAVSVTVKF